MRMQVLALLLVALGCGKSQNAATGSGSAPAGSGSAGSVGSAASPKVGDISVTIDGKPLAVESAFAKHLPDGRYQIYLGSGGSCEELLTNVFDGHNPHVLLDLRTFMLADGGDSIGAGDVYADGPPMKADDSTKASIRGELTKGTKLPIDLEVTSAEAKLAVKGRVTVEACGEQDVPPAVVAGNPTMKIAGKPFLIRAALVRGDDLELSDLPRDCTMAHYIGVRLQREHGTWKLDGTRIPVELTGPAPALKVTAAPVDKSLPAGHKSLELAGSDKVAAYSVELAGVVDATDCNYKAK